MTEAEWLASSDVGRMLASRRRRASQRKLRLFAVACCIHVDMAAEQNQQALVVAERLADGLTTQNERREKYKHLRTRTADWVPESVIFAAHGHAFIAARRAAESSCMEARVNADNLATRDDRVPAARRAHALETERQGHLLRDIFGNPFRPVGFSPDWRTTDVMLLALGIYDDRAFDRMPILADALQDAGCDNDDVLNHCRDSAQVHVRGCWVVDAVLGKE